jgi:tetratricopeptide (TPR) repeat protein
MGRNESAMNGARHIKLVILAQRWLHGGVKLVVLLACAGCLGYAALSRPLRATSGSQDQQGQGQPNKPDTRDSGESSSKQPDITPPKDKPAYNPLPAEQDVDVGVFYMHKGDVDAAIPRFEDAIQLRANYAKPRLLLAEAYEKKGDKSNAVKYYKEYLKVFPGAPDAKKVEKKIEKLSG